MQDSLDSLNISQSPGHDTLLTGASILHLKETAKWSKFLAIVGFVSVGLIVVGAIFMGTMMGAMGNAFAAEPQLAGLGAFPGVLGAVLYLLIALLYFFPCLYLMRFADSTKRALASNDRVELENAFKNLKSVYKFIGITTIVTLAIYVLGFLFAILGAAAFSGF